MHENVKTIEKSAFARCRNLEKINLPKQLKTMAKSAFMKTGIKEIEIPGSIRGVQVEAFYCCDKLEKVIMHEGIVKLWSESFRGCQNLLEIQIPKSVEEIGKSAFAGCCNLKEIEVPKSVEIIKSFTFERCRALEKVIINAKEIDFKINAFSRCDKIKEVKIPMQSNILLPVELQYPAIKEWLLKYKTFSVEEKIRIDEYIELRRKLITEKLFEKSNDVKTLKAYLENIKPSKVQAKNSLKKVSQSNVEFRAMLMGYINELKKNSIEVELDKNEFKLKKTTKGFILLKYLLDKEEVVIPNEFYRIEKGAFDNCKSMKKISIPDHIYIDRNLFLKCNNLFDENGLIIVSDKLLNIGVFEEPIWGRVKMYRSKKAKIVVPENVKEIEDNCFSCINGIEEIILPKGLKKIGESAFELCANLKKINIPENVKKIESYTFAECKSLKEVILPKSVQRIEENAFERCYNLEKLFIFGDIEKFEQALFEDSWQLKELRVEPKFYKTLDTQSKYAVFVYLQKNPQDESYTEWMRLLSRIKMNLLEMQIEEENLEGIKLLLSAFDNFNTELLGNMLKKITDLEIKTLIMNYNKN